MSLVSSTAKITSGGFYDFPIEQSLRFDGVSSYLSRTPAQAGNRKTWTFSVWVKYSTLNYGTIFHQYDGVSGNRCLFGIQSDFTFQANSGGSGTNINKIITTSVYRDPSSWYHFLIANDTTQITASDRIKLWVNGVEILTTKTPATQNTDGLCNSANLMEIGLLAGGYFNGYLANIQFIDGQALDQYFFGESKNGVWIPYNAFTTAGSGTATASDADTATDSYGTNGFHLTFADGIESLSVEGYAGSVNAFRDKSGNNKHWKIN
jgi:hypothetical protein